MHSPKQKASAPRERVTNRNKSTARTLQDTEIMFYSSRQEQEITDPGTDGFHIPPPGSAQDESLNWLAAYAHVKTAMSALEGVNIGLQVADTLMDTFCKENTAAARYIRPAVEKLCTITYKVKTEIENKLAEKPVTNLLTMEMIHGKLQQKNVDESAELSVVKRVLEQNAEVIANMALEGKGKDSGKITRPRESPTPPGDAPKKKSFAGSNLIWWIQRTPWTKKDRRIGKREERRNGKNDLKMQRPEVHRARNRVRMHR